MWLDSGMDVGAAVVRYHIRCRQCQLLLQSWPRLTVVGPIPTVENDDR